MSQSQSMRDIVTIVEQRIESETRNVLDFSATDIAAEFGISVPTAAGILRGLGAEYDDKLRIWYMPEVEEE